MGDTREGDTSELASGTSPKSPKVVGGRVIQRGTLARLIRNVDDIHTTVFLGLMIFPCTHRDEFGYNSIRVEISRVV